MFSKFQISLDLNPERLNYKAEGLSAELLQRFSVETHFAYKNHCMSILFFMLYIPNVSIRKSTTGLSTERHVSSGTNDSNRPQQRVILPTRVSLIASATVVTDSLRRQFKPEQKSRPPVASEPALDRSFDSPYSCHPPSNAFIRYPIIFPARGEGESNGPGTTKSHHRKGKLTGNIIGAIG